MTVHPTAGMARPCNLWQGAGMDQRNARAGGFFLTAAIILGLIAGIVIGSPITGVIAGSLAGGAIAAVTWLIDSRRRF